MYKVLIIEDEPEIRSELALLLRNEGYEASSIDDFTDTLADIERHKPDLILLDLGLPVKDGFSLCAEIRRSSRVPIIFVTSRSSSMDELQALSLGGDDYITKPYNIPVLLARIKASLRRSQPAPAEESMECEGLRLDLRRGMLSAGEKSCEATKNEIKILVCLMSRPGEIVHRADLINYLWDNQIYIDDNTLSVNVTRLRGKLNELGLPDYIKTRRGMGYVI